MTLFADPSIAAPPRAGQYHVIYADPPWLERGGGQTRRGANRHYPLMKTDEICALPTREWAAPDAHLYLWVTNNFLEDGFEVMKAWGFRPVTKIDWFKGDLGDLDEIDIRREVTAILGTFVNTYLTSDNIGVIARRIETTLVAATDMSAFDDRLQMGIGQYFRGVSESCLFGVRGVLPYRTHASGKRAQGRTAFHAPRGEHSAKPSKMRQMIECVSPGPYLEMFARKPVDGWDVWGLESDGSRVRA